MHQSYQSCRSFQPTAEDRDTRSRFPGRYTFLPEHRDWRHTHPCLQSDPKQSSLHNQNRDRVLEICSRQFLTRFSQSKTVSSLNHLWGRCAKWIHMNRILLHSKWGVAFHIKHWNSVIMWWVMVSKISVNIDRGHTKRQRHKQQRKTKVCQWEHERASDFTL